MSATRRARQLRQQRVARLGDALVRAAQSLNHLRRGGTQLRAPGARNVSGRSPARERQRRERRAPAAAHRTKTPRGRPARRPRPPWPVRGTLRCRAGGRSAEAVALCHVIIRCARSPFSRLDHNARPCRSDGVHGRRLGVSGRLPGTARMRAAACRASATLNGGTRPRAVRSRLHAPQIFVTLRTGKTYPPTTVDVRCAALQSADSRAARGKGR